jgi:ABC-2 type transport system ATP-binding protein
VPDDEDWLIKELCAKEYFGLLARVYREAGVSTDITKRVAALSNMLHFTSHMQPLESLSHGNKKKVQLIAGLMHSPKVIILDEVRNGLDPLAIIATEQLLTQETKRGACIIATTHDLSWAERTADDILLLTDGKIHVHEKTAAIVKCYGSLQKLFLQSLGGKQA